MRADGQRRLGFAGQVRPCVAGLVDLRLEPDLAEQLAQKTPCPPPAPPPTEPLCPVVVSGAALELPQVGDDPSGVDRRAQAIVSIRSAWAVQGGAPPPRVNVERSLALPSSPG